MLAGIAIVFAASWTLLGIELSSYGWDATGLVLWLALGLAGVLLLLRLRALKTELRLLDRYVERLSKVPHAQLQVPQRPALGLPQRVEELALATQAHIRDLTQHGHDLEAVLSSMHEGVLALNSDGQVLRLNQATLELLGLPPGEWRGKSLEEVVRNNRLQRFIAETLRGNTSREGDLLLYDRGERFVQAYGTKLVDAQGQDLGALIVLNDITRLKQLENVRRDFVANVSHELRTPITSIKGFVETLRDGALDSPRDARRFLEIISRQADRLNAIFDDLLKLAQIEIERDRELIEFEMADLTRIARQACESKAAWAAAKEVCLELKSNGAVFARVNANLIEQALINLIDNAIRHSGEKQTIVIAIEQSDSETVLSVSDHGCGIPAQHLARLFERFYRVDRARSRDLGGTGLGLAIVKHIAQAHGGQPRVESELNRGSTFYLHLPRNVQAETKQAA